MSRNAGLKTRWGEQEKETVKEDGERQKWSNDDGMNAKDWQMFIFNKGDGSQGWSQKDVLLEATEVASSVQTDT